MATLGDIINELSSTTPLSGTGTTMSLPIIISEYSSLTLIMLSDADTTVTVRWSADGVNFYYSDIFKFLANTPNQAVTSVSSKWVQVKITNTNQENATQLDLKCYASPGNNAVNAIIQGITAKVLAEIDVKKSFAYTATGELLSESIVPDQQYTFNKCRDNDNLLITTYDTINFFEYGLTGTSVQSSNKGVIKLLDLPYSSVIDPTSDIIAQSCLTSTKYTKWLPGYGLSCMFSCAFNNRISQFTGATGSNLLICGMGNQDLNLSLFVSPEIIDGVFIGFIKSTGATQSTIPDNFGIFIYRFGLLYKFIPQSQWNIDKCNGEGPIPPMPVIVNWRYMFTYKFSILAQGDLLVSIVNPNTGVISPVHFEKFSNVPEIGPEATFKDLSFQMIARYEPLLLNGGVTGTNAELDLASWMIGFESSNPIYQIDRFNQSIPAYINSPSDGTPTLQINAYNSGDNKVWYRIAAVGGIYNSIKFNNSDNHTTIYVDNISVSFFSINNGNFGSDTPFIIQLIKNIPFTPNTNPETFFSLEVSEFGYRSPVKYTNLNDYITLSQSNYEDANPIFEAPVNIYPTKTESSYACQYDLSPYNIQLYPKDYLLVIIARLGETQNTINGVFCSTNIGFHQLH